MYTNYLLYNIYIQFIIFAESIICINIAWSNSTLSEKLITEKKNLGKIKNCNRQK